jgi:hypothetical protein
MKYLCLVYHDDRQLAALPQGEFDALVGEACAYDDELRQSGHYLASDALEGLDTATIIRVREGRVSVTAGSCGEAQERLGGFLLIEARDLNEAIRVATKIPSARVGSIEVRSVKEATANNGAGIVGSYQMSPPAWRDRPG